MQSSPIMAIVTVRIGRVVGAWTQDKNIGPEGSMSEQDSVLLKIITLFLSPVNRYNIIDIERYYGNSLNL